MKSESNGHLELADAAAPTLREIGRLAASAPPRIAAMLIYIRDHLFDPELSVYRLKEACRSRDNSIALHFHQAVGQPPGIFITDKRMTVAERLLTGTWLPIWKISQLLGYSSIQVFSRAYCRCNGRRPSAIRKQASAEVTPAAAATVEMVPVGLPLHPQEGDLMRRALAGHLEDQEAAHLVCRLLELYPPHRRTAA